MKHSRSRQLVLSIAIVAMMLSTSLLFQGAGATSAGGIFQQSYAMTAGADGRWFGVVNETMSYPAIERVDFDHPFEIFFIDYTHDYLQQPVSPPGPMVALVSPGTTGFIDPLLYSTGPLSTNIRVPNFIMTHNTTKDVVSPTQTIWVKDNITLGFGVTTEFQVDPTNVVVVTLGVSSAEQGKILALTGLVTGAGASVYLYDPNGNLISDFDLDVGYFAYPFLANTQGYYRIHFTSTSSNYIKIAPIVVPTTSMAIGQFASGEIKIPETITEDTLLTNDYQPSQIVALSYDVSALSEYAFAFSMFDSLGGDSDYACFYYDVGTRWDGTPRWGTLAQAPETTVEPLVSRAAVSGKVYIVLVGNFMSKFQYAFGVESATVPTAPLDEPFPVVLPTPLGVYRQLYHFSIPAESIVRMNCTVPSDPMYAEILKFSTSGVVYSTGVAEVDDLGSWIWSGLAVSNYASSMYMGVGDYLLVFDAPWSTDMAMQINTYPIENYTSGNAFNAQVHTCKALAIDVASEFELFAFNVTLLSQLNASMIYRLSLFDDYNRLTVSFLGDGESLNKQGLANREESGSWQGKSGAFYTDPDSSGTLEFSGNESLQVCQFISTYVGRYFLTLDFYEGYNTNTTGLSNLQRWRWYEDLTVSLKIELFKSKLFNGLPLKYLTLDSTSGTGSVSTVINGTGMTVVFLKLNPIVNAWTRISTSIVNGTGNPSVPRAIPFDKIRTFSPSMPALTFDFSESKGLWPPYDDTVINIWGYPNTTFHVEFGTIRQTMMILFPVYNTGALHTIATFSVKHYNTVALSGLVPTGGAPPVSAAPFPVEILLIAGVAAIVVVAVVAAYFVIKKRKA